MENRINYTLIGVFFVAIVTAIGGFMWWMISYGDDANEYRSYYILTSDLPRGIKKDSAVKFIGVDAGVVRNIRFADLKEAKIELELWIRDGLPIKKDSSVTTEIQGITGISYLNIQKGSENSPVFSQDEKPYIELEANFFEKIGEKATDITQNIDKTFINLNSFLTEQNAQKLANILNSADKLVSNFSELNSNLELNSTLQNLNEAILEFKNLAKNGSKTLQNINSFSESLKNVAVKFGDLQNLIQSKIKDGEYNFKDGLNLFIDESLGALDEFQKTLKEFRQTLFRLEDRPYEFFFKDPEQKEKR